MNTENTKTPNMPETIRTDHRVQDPLEALRDIIATTDSPVLVVYHETEECHAILKAIKGSCYYDGTSLMLKRWNDRKYPVMLIHPLRAVKTQDFGQIGHTVIWFSAPSDDAEYEQVNSRVNQTGGVNIHRIIDVNEPTDKWETHPGPEDDI